MNKQELLIIQLPLLFFHPSRAWGANQHTSSLEIYPTDTVQWFSNINIFQNLFPFR